MSTISGRYVQRVEGQIRGIDWASTNSNRVELSVRCGRGVTFFTVERDAGHGFQDSVMHEELYPKRGALITLHDYTAPPGRDVIYRATFFTGSDDEVGVPMVVSVPTHWTEAPW